jgi:glucose/arabinose dehydrogenase
MRAFVPAVLRLGLLALLGLLVVSGPPVDPSRAEAEWPQPQLRPVVDGLAQPVHVTHAGDGSGRLFVAERAGRVRIVKEGHLMAAPFLDIRGRVQSNFEEQGLLSVAFPPGDAAKDGFYVFYTARRDPDGGGSVLTVSHFAVTADPDVADPDTEQKILTVDHPTFANHNGGMLAFGPDGHLYAGTGDGGSGGDPADHAQDPHSLLGKLLRLDAENGASAPEVWALGLRNPWRFAFDPATGDLYVADVGQGAYEEVDFQPAPLAAGANYGWPCREGLHRYRSAAGCGGALADPVAEYLHANGDCAVVGGRVYRGPEYPRMVGVYIYGDYCTGALWGLRRDGGAWVARRLAQTGHAISSFGEDQAGRLYLADLDTGSIYEVVDPRPATFARALR